MIAFVASLAVAPAIPGGDDRLAVGSKWSCSAAFPSDRYTAELIVEQGRSPGEKNLRVVSASGDIGLSGYGVGSAKAGHFDKNGSDLVAEFGQGFYNYGLEMMTHWDRNDPAVEIDGRTFKVGAASKAERNERSFVLTCKPLAAERS